MLVSIKWTINDFENFPSDFISHIVQQHHLRYILNTVFHSLWLKHGHNPYVNLGLASKMNVHISVIYVTLEQLYDDISFLTFALKQTLKSRGGDLVIKEQETNDGIVVYHNLIGRYRYGGDRETYKSKLFLVLAAPYYSRFPGDALSYLDLWKDATIRLENLLSEEAYSSKTKRSVFVNNFTVINETDQIIEQVRDSIDT